MANYYDTRYGGAASSGAQAAQPRGGIVGWLRDRVGGSLVPRLSRGTVQQRELQKEKAAAGPRNVIQPVFMPYFRDGTAETPQMRAAYRRMLADPNVKAALVGKIFGVAA